MSDTTDGAWRQVAAGTSLTRWNMAEPQEVLFPGKARPMPDKVDYRFRNGWVDTGDLPCREALREWVTTRKVTLPDTLFPNVYLGLDSDDVDFSRFCHRPTLITRSFRCRLRTQAGGPAVFRLSTCGGVHLWIGENHAGSFEPFQRNTPSSAEIDTYIPAGETTLTVLLEDLHERDTTCFFSLTCLEGPGLETAVSGAADPDTLRDTEHVMAGLRTDSIFYENGTVSLCVDSPLSRPVSLTVEGMVPFGRGGLTADPSVTGRKDVCLTPGAPRAALFDVSGAGTGCLSLQVTARIGQAKLTRQLGTTLLKAGQVLTGDLAARKAQAATAIADHRGFDPSVAALLAARGEGGDHVERVLEAVLTTIEQRYDCSDFSILPLLRIWCNSRSSLSAALSERLKQAVLGYRYWLDEPGDDVMWFWSENHVLCFHTAQLVAGGLFPDQVFPNSGKTGLTLRKEAAARLNRWFSAIREDGLCEWNSAAYYPIDLLALLTLHDLEPDFRSDCAGLLDQIFVMTGLHTSGGTPAGSQGRCYEKELLAGPGTELGSVAAIAFGGRFNPGYDRAAALFCLSSYTPPAAAAGFATLTGGEWLEARYTQGLGHAGKLTLWKSAMGQLSTVTDLKTGEQGHQAQVLDVQLSGHPMARLWINHPGELKVWGERRPSLLAGSHVMPRVAQYGPTGCLIFDLDRPWTDIGFTQLFAAPGAFDAPKRVQGWSVFRSGEALAGVWCSRQTEGVTGLYQGALLRAHGLRTAWVVALPAAGESRDAFETRLRATEPHFDETRMVLTFAAHDGQSFELSFAGDLLIGGQKREFGPLTVHPHLGRNGAALQDWRTLDD